MSGALRHRRDVSARWRGGVIEPTQVWKEKEMRRQLLLDPKPPKRKKQPLRLKKGQVQHVIKKDEWEPPPRAHCPPTRPQSASAMRRENKHQKLVWKMHRRDKRMIAASRGAVAPSRRRRASSPGMMAVGGFLRDFELFSGETGSGAESTGETSRMVVLGAV